MIEELTLPRWDVSAYFPSLVSEEFSAAEMELKFSIAALEKSILELGDLNPNSPELVSSFENVLKLYNETADQLRLISTYVRCFVNTDSKDDVALHKDSELDPFRVALQAIRTRWVGIIRETDIESLFSKSDLLKDHEFAFQKAKVVANHQMSEPEELLAGQLRTTGSQSWEKLYGSYTSILEGDVVVRGEKKRLPMSSIRALAYDPIEATRESAYCTELRVWESHRVPLAATLNAIKGEHISLSKRRDWNSPLDESLFSANIDREILGAMQEAIREALPVWRKYLKVKGKRLGYTNGLPWFSLFAPIGGQSKGEWNYIQGSEAIYEAFSEYDNDLVEYAKFAIQSQWVDAEPRSGKVDGAYCAGTMNGESRILMNFKPSFSSVSTLAHELGHGYHNWLLKDRTSAQRQTPMTLAETASIFCETLLVRHGIRNKSGEEVLQILEASLMGNCQVIVDIHSRFLFEKEVFDRRGSSELSADELCSVMKKAQLDSYGDGLDSDYLHPYMWAAKSHYYSGLQSFYNYPYTFGLLFGLGLFAIFEAEPKGFSERYKNLLSSTGMMDADDCAKEFGINIRSKDFWKASLGVLEQSVNQFVELSLVS